jgi:hypothetical protein
MAYHVTEKNRWNYIFMSPAVLKKQINGSLYSVSVGAETIKTQLPTSGIASECFLAHKRCLSGGETAPFAESFMLQSTSFWREGFLSRQLEPNLNKMGTYAQRNYHRAFALSVLLL